MASSTEPTCPPPSSLNIDDLFLPTGGKKVEEVEYIESLCFVNNLNTYCTRVIADKLANKNFKTFNKRVKPSGGDGEEAEEEATEEIEEEEEEEMDEEDVGEEGQKVKKLKPPKEKWKVIGTVTDRKIKTIEDVTEIVKFQKNETFGDKIFKCAVIVYDITGDIDQIVEADWVLDELCRRIECKYETEPKHFDRQNEVRFFILISTVMTWALTKPISLDDPNTPFQENDYRKRKPHPNYKLHINLERKTVQCGKKFPKKLKTIVIAAGIVYGLEEDDLSYIFHMAWLCRPEKIPLFNGGKNTMPLIHINDLANIVLLLLKKLPTKPYILAVEQQPCKMRQIVKAVSREMGTGEIIKVAREEIFLYSDISQAMFDRTMLNLRMEPSYIQTELALPWQSDLNLAQNAAAICQEFKMARKLAPIKIVLHGPPAVGKTILAKRLCDKYRLNYLHIKDVIDDMLEFLHQTIKSMEAEAEEAEAEKEEEEQQEDEEQDEEQEEKPTLEDYTVQLNELESALNDSPKGRLPQELTIKLLKQTMYKNKLLNQGWVLDNYPKTIDEATELFGIDEEDGEEDLDGEDGAGGGGPQYNMKTMPEFVFSLEADDDFLCERMMNLPESSVQGTHYTEEHMIRRLDEFRTLNTEDNTVLNFYDENEVHPHLIDATVDPTDPTMETIFQKMCTIIGKPRNLGPSKAELEQLAKQAEIDELNAIELKKREQEELERKLQNEYLEKMENWADMMLQIQQEEEEILAVKGEPMRNYLMKYVFPTLTRGLLEVAQLRPTDPIDFLAEYLFKENPEGKMFDPAYVATAGEFMNAVQQLQNVLVGNVDELGKLRQKVHDTRRDSMELLAETFNELKFDS